MNSEADGTGAALFTLAQRYWDMGRPAYAADVARTVDQYVTAARAAVAPQRISYRHTLMLIRNFWLAAWLAPPGERNRSTSSTAWIAVKW